MNRKLNNLKLISNSTNQKIYLNEKAYLLKIDEIEKLEDDNELITNSNLIVLNEALLILFLQYLSYTTNIIKTNINKVLDFKDYALINKFIKDNIKIEIKNNFMPNVNFLEADFSFDDNLKLANALISDTLSYPLFSDFIKLENKEIIFYIFYNFNKDYLNLYTMQYIKTNDNYKFNKLNYNKFTRNEIATIIKIVKENLS